MSENNREVCPFHTDLETRQQESFKLLDRKVPSWVFVLIMSVFVGLIGTMSVIQFGIISSNTSAVGAKLDGVANSMMTMQLSQGRVESKITNLADKFNSFKEYAEKEHRHFDQDINLLKEKVNGL